MPGIRKPQATKPGQKSAPSALQRMRAARQSTAEPEQDQQPESLVQEVGRDWRDQLKQARDARAAATDRMDALLNTLEGVAERQVEQGEALSEVDANYGVLLDAIDGLSKDVSALAKTETDLSSARAIGYDHATAKKDEKFSFGRAVAGWMNNWEGDWGKSVELEILRSTYKQQGMNEGQVERALQFGVGSAGGLLIAAQLLSEYIEVLRPNTVAGALGARFRPFSGPVSIRRMLGGATSYWTGEGKKAVKSQPTTGRINLTPKPLVTVVPISDDLIGMGPDSLMGDVEADMAAAQGADLDKAVMIGTGGDGQPTGIKHIAGGSTSFSAIDYLGADQNVTDLIEAMVAAIGARNVRGRVAFATHPLSIAKLRTSKDAQGQPLLKWTIDPDRNGETWIETGTIHNYRYATTTQLGSGATADLIAAAWNEIIVASFGVAEVYPSREATDTVTGDSAFLQRETWIRLTTQWDTALRYTEAVQVATGWNAS